MPKGIPVGTLAVGSAGAVNAALLAVSILSLADDTLRERYLDFRKAQSAATFDLPGAPGHCWCWTSTNSSLRMFRGTTDDAGR